MSALLGAVVLLPLAGVAVTLLLPERRRAAVALVVAVATTAAVVLLTARTLDVGSVRVAVAGFDPPLGIALVADGLSVTFLAMTALVVLAVTVYATGARTARGGGVYWALWLGLWSSLNAVYLSGDLFNIYVALELMGLSAVGLVALAGRDAIPAAFRYLMIAVLGSLAYLVGVSLVYAEFGTLDIEAVGARADTRAALVAAAVLATVGMALKSALFPLHAWLPAAHAGAPSAVSPALSALVISASVYVVTRLWSTALPDVAGPASAQVLGVLGAGAVVWGSLLALRQERLKLLVAYSTVAQVGYFFLVFPLALGGEVERAAAADGWAGVLLLVVSHGLAKAAMFMAAGTLAFAYGGDRIAGMVGAATRRPVACATFALAGVALAGLPPSLGFAGKWLVLQSGLASGQWWWVVLVLVGGLLTAAYVGRVLRVVFVQTDPDGAPPAELRHVPRRMEVTGLSLAALAVVLGFASYGPARLLIEAFPPGGAS